MKNYKNIMAWNEPGGNKKDSGSEDPWKRNNRQDSGPPDLELIFRKLLEKIKKSLFNDSKPSQGSGGGNGFSDQRSRKEYKVFGLSIAGVLLFFYIVGGFYIVEPPERAVVTRLGKYVRTNGPGPHWLPLFLESKEIINVEQVATSDHSGLMLTGDRNIASVGIAVQYKIGDEDVRAFLFNVVSPIQSLKQSAESAMRQVVGKYTMDEVLTLKRAEITTAIKDQLIETLKNYHTGINVLDVAMQFAKPPDEVRAAFDDVIRAATDAERSVNQARAYENEILPKATGTVEKLKNEALGYKQATILLAEGNVQRFNSILPEYQKAPKVTQTRLFLESMEEVLKNTTKVIVDGGLGNNVIYLPIDKKVLAPIAPVVQESEKSQ